EVCSALRSHLDRHGKRGLVHTLLVDEVQDYSLDEVHLFLDMAENVFFVGDVRQQIYESDLTFAAVKAPSNAGEARLFELTNHYRIGEKICALADRLAKPSKEHRSIAATCRYDERQNPSEVGRFELSFDAQIQRVIQRCQSQMAAFPGELVGVLCPTNDVL